MKIAIPNCPECGQKADGTLDLIPGLALIVRSSTRPDCFEWAGETKMFWDEQKTVRRNELPILMCANGHEWESKINWSDDVEPASTTDPAA